LQTNSGEFYAIGEGYRKAASAAGIASAALSMGGGRGGASIMKLEITDLGIIHFDAGFKVLDAKIYEKYNNSMELPGGSETMSPHTMALLAKAYGAFDYNFTKQDKEHTRFTVGYTDYEKSGEDKGLNFHAISVNAGKITEDKVSLRTKAKWVRVFPAKSGFIAVLEYMKKEKRLDFRLEKIN
jgi:hypothetical protein